jgi:hypothetical protein
MTASSRKRLVTPTGVTAMVIVIAGLVAGCGSSQPKSTSAKAAATPVASTPAAPTPAAIAFVTPKPGAAVGSTVRALVHLTGTGRVQFILDSGPPRSTSGLALTLRHLSPGAHRLIAQLLPADKASAVSATVHFRVRPATVAVKHPAVAPEPAAVPVSPSPPARAPAPATTHGSAPSASSPPPSPTPAPPATTPTHQNPPTATQPQSSGIPQGGGGDGDADNNGGPSDGDGNI